MTVLASILAPRLTSANLGACFVRRGNQTALNLSRVWRLAGEPSFFTGGDGVFGTALANAASSIHPEAAGTKFFAFKAKSTPRTSGGVSLEALFALPNTNGRVSTTHLSYSPFGLFFPALAASGHLERTFSDLKALQLLQSYPQEVLLPLEDGAGSRLSLLQASLHEWLSSAASRIVSGASNVFVRR